MLHEEGHDHKTHLEREMMAKGYRIKGHESFIPREGWITKGLMSVHDNPKVFFNLYGADDLGVGTNMAKSIRYWLKTAGLITDNNKGANLTPLGKIILSNDPYLEDVFTLWILHINISTNFSSATTWNVFFNDMNATHFKRDELVAVMQELLLAATGEEKLPLRSVKDDCYAILSMYTDVTEKNDDPEDKKVSPFAELGLIHQSGNFFERVRPDIAKIDPLVVLYMLEKAFDDMAPTETKNSIQIDDLTDLPNMPGKVLNLNRIMVNDFLDVLANRGYIIVNRTAGLDIVYRETILSPEAVLKKYYEGRDGN